MKSRPTNAVRVLEDVPDYVAQIESQLSDALRSLKKYGPRARQAWVPVVRASHLAEGLLYRGIDFWIAPRSGPQALVPYFERRDTMSELLLSMTEVGSETKTFLRYSLRPRTGVPEHDYPHSPQRLRSLKRGFAAERRWLGNFLSPPPSADTASDTAPGLVRGPDPDAIGDVFDAPLLHLEPPSTINTGVAETAIEYDTATANDAPTRIVVPGSFQEDRGERTALLTAPEYLRTRRYKVWFGTNRLPVGVNGFSDRGAADLRVGACEVYIPKTHQFGSLGSSWMTRVIGRLLSGRKDDRVRLERTSVLTQRQFADSLTQEISRWPVRSALLIVHGYNVDFGEAARRSAQIGFDLRIDGITAFYSWPSRGRILPYTHDEEAVQEAERHFMEFIRLLSTVREISEINILAHSMGNRLLVRTVRDLLSLQRSGELAVPIGQIILAAADVPRAVFTAHAAAYREVAQKRVTSYSCTQDYPLKVSRGLHGRDRVGLEPPIFVCNGVESISAADLDLHGLGHGYYAETEALLYDLGELIHDNKPPNRRIRLEPGPTAAGEHWVFRR